ncbi:MAG: alanine--glyoxylate aminotransferase family protein [Saprospiraceae bacterium]|nr:alanine--glyoxylate aminotransferase family protein [Saprospiraceae bacterium]
MPGLLSNVDPDGLLEYSVVYTDRSLNHMSAVFQKVMNDISVNLKKVYQADAVVVVPGGGTYGMEAVARQFATGKNCLVIRNGWFSFRWSQIFDVGKIPASHRVLKARPSDHSNTPAFTPPTLDEVLDTIKKDKPDLVFAPHVETSSGMILPEDYLRQVAEAVHEYGGLFVLDCIASGTIWIDMKKIGVDVLISAPQKGWSGPPSSGLVMLSAKAMEMLPSTTSTSFACDLKKWHQIMEAYEKGGHAYHATMPTDALRAFRDVMLQTVDFGLKETKLKQEELGRGIRTLLESFGFKSVAGEGYQAPGVVVSYTDDPDIKSGKKFKECGLQIAAGVPLQCDEPPSFQTFRVGLFGLDKLKNVDRTIKTFADTLSEVTNPR